MNYINSTQINEWKETHLHWHWLPIILRRTCSSQHRRPKRLYTVIIQQQHINTQSKLRNNQDKCEESKNGKKKNASPYTLPGLPAANCWPYHRKKTVTRPRKPTNGIGTGGVEELRRWFAKMASTLMGGEGREGRRSEGVGSHLLFSRQFCSRWRWRCCCRRWRGGGGRVD